MNKLLKDASRDILEIVKLLADRTVSEMHRLRAHNSRFSRELAILREELKAHRHEFEELRAATK